MRQALLLLILLMFPLWSHGDADKMRADDSRSAVTETRDSRNPSSTQKDSPNLPCHAQTNVDKAKSMAKLGNTTDCVDDDAIRRTPSQEIGRPLKYQ